MHPTFSVIFFTTATGAGYGLLALLGTSFAIGALPQDRLFGAVTLGLALILITAGLISSTAHLGHPERAWRAFSQWRSSWLSREGVASVATYVPVGLFAIGWVMLGRADVLVISAGLAATIGAVATIVTTGMIYASLKPIPQWSSRYTVPGYLIASAMTGAVLLNAALHLFHAPAGMIGFLAPLAIALGWAWKLATWRHNDALDMPATASAAIGLSGGTIRSIEWPHTEENYVLKEMGYRIARKHSAKLRRFVQLCAFAIPLAATTFALCASDAAAAVAAVLAALIQIPGVLADRWLFFAEAKHIVTLYYGR